MIPRKLLLRNFMCYREDVPPLEFDGISIACLSGENGAGKSALLDALTWALWGEARLRSDDDLIALGAQEMEVDLTFALDGQDYRIIRKRTKTKRGQSWLDFQVRNNGSWKVITGATLPETQQLIDSTLHMGYETFTNSAFLRQGRADEFTRRKPAERKKVLAEILGLDIYEGLANAAKEKAKGLDGRTKVVDGQIAELERQAEQREVYARLVVEAEARVDQLTADVADAELVWAKANESVQALERLKPQRDECRVRIERLQSACDELIRQVEARRRTYAEAAQIVARRDEIHAGVATLQAARAELERLDGLRSDYDALIERRRSHDEALREAKRRLETDLRLAQGELRRLREHAARRPAIEAEMTRLRTQLAVFTNLSKDLVQARSRRAELLEQTRTVNELQLQRKDLEGQIKLKHDSLVATREEIKRRLKDATTRLKDVDLWQAELAHAAEERSKLTDEMAQLEQLRLDEHESVERTGALRAACNAARTQGEEINKKLALLGPEAHACPLCGSELGHDGIAHIETEYERERSALRAQYSAAKREADALEAQLVKLRAEIKAHERRVATMPEVAGKIARLEGDLRMAEEVRQRSVEDQRTHDELALQIMKGDYERGTRSELARIESMIAALGDPKALEREMKRLEAGITKLEEQISAQADLRAQLESQQRDLQAIDAEAAALHALETQTSELATTLELNDYAHDDRIALARLDTEIANMGYAPEQHQAIRSEVKKLAHWADEERQLQRAEERLQDDAQGLARDEEMLRRQQEDLVATTEQLTKIDQDLRTLAPAIRQRDEAANALQTHRRALAVAQRDLGERQGSLQRAEQAAAELVTCQEQRRALTARKELFDELTTAFGKKGVQALLIETAIPEIEHEANTMLARMTDNQMHLSFETQRDTKKGDVSETLEIKIADALGTRDYDAYSGGESFRVDFAIRIALAKLLARRAGARLETLVIDEGFGSQDTRGRERLVEAITSVQRDFKRILVVTHIQELKDMFPVQIEVMKTDRGSTWTIG